MTREAVQLSPELVESLRERYGNLADHIGIQRTMIDGHDDTYELSVIFYTRCIISRLSEESRERAVMHAAHKLCDLVDKTVLDRVPNRTHAYDQSPNVTFHVSHNVPEGMALIHPKTYYEMVGR